MFAERKVNGYDLESVHYTVASHRLYHFSVDVKTLVFQTKSETQTGQNANSKGKFIPGGSKR